MKYAYKCRSCGRQKDSNERGDTLGLCVTPGCQGELRRLFSVSVWRPMMEHFNPTVGKIISSNHQMDEELKRQSEEYTLRTGIEAKFVRHDPADAKALGVTSDGIEESNVQRVAEGLHALPTPV